MQNITFYPTIFSGGNLIIDKKTLDKLNFKAEDKIICYMNSEEELIIKKQKDICIFCGQKKSLHTICDASICNVCREDLVRYSFDAGDEHIL